MARSFKGAIVAIAAAATGCTAPSPYVVIDGFAQGTTYHFVLQASDTAGLQGQIDSLFAAVDASMSVYFDGSLINRLNANETDSVDRYIAYCIDLAREASELSDGMFDITVKPITQAWGFAGKGMAAEPNVDSLLQFVGYQGIRIEHGRLVKDDPRMQLDLNTVAKGYTVDLLGELMESRGLENYLIEVGGEIFCRGRNRNGTDWVVGIDKPFEGNFIPGDQLQVKLSLTDSGLATSGNYRKFYEDAHGRKVTHIVNARTGMGEPSNLLSATVIAETSAKADVYGTLFMVVGLDRSIEILSRRDDIMGYLIYSDEDGNYLTWYSPRLESHIVE